MPPKRKADQKTEEAPTVTKESPSKKMPSKNDIEPATRVLRPRKEPVPIPDKPKTEKVKKPKSTKVGDSNGPSKAGSKKKGSGSNKGKKAEAEENAEEEESIPPAKIPKLNAVDEEEDGDYANASSVYDFSAKTIQGEEISLNKYKGHVCIIVNVASKCGHTSSNYKEFVELYEKYENKGLKILAFPCNQFGKQEPGDNEKICEFAKKRNVTFDMFEKIDVNGKKAHPLWKYLTSQKDGPKGADIDWNFTKFLINKDGQVVERFKSAVKPWALEKELEKLW